MVSAGSGITMKYAQGCIWAAVAVLTAPVAVRAGSSGIGVWQEVRIADQPGAACRLQLDVYAVTGPQDRLAELAHRPAEDLGSTSAEILASLRRVGDVRVLARFDEPAVLETPTRLESTCRVPVSTSLPSGRTSVNYESIGCTAELQGSWREDGTTASVRLQATARWLVPAREPAGTEGKKERAAAATGMAQSMIETQTSVTAGRPAVVLGGVTAVEPGGRGKDGASPPCGLTVGRMVLTRTASAVARPAPPGESLQYALQFFELEGRYDRLASFDPDRDLVAFADTTSDEILHQLATFGRTRLVGRSTVLLKGSQPGTINIGPCMPGPAGQASAGSAPDQGAAARRDPAGFEAELVGRWLPEIDPQLTEVTCRINRSTQPAAAPASRRGPQSARATGRWRGKVRADRPVWLPRQVTHSDSKGNTFGLLLTRLTVSKPAAAAQEASSRPTEPSDDAGEASGPLRVQVDLYRLVGEPQRLAKLDLTELKNESSGGEGVLQILGDYGEARAVAGLQATLHPGERVQVNTGADPQRQPPSDVDAAAGDGTGPGFARASVQGKWQGDRPPAARLSVTLAWTRLPPPDSEARAGAIAETQIEREVDLAPGDSAWVASNEYTWSDRIRTASSPESAKPGSKVIVLARLQVVGRTPARAASRVLAGRIPRAPGRAAEEPAPSRSSQPDRLLMNLFVLKCPQEVFLRTDFDAISGRATTREAAMAVLGSLGEVTFVRGAEGETADLGRTLSLTSGERVPAATAMTSPGRSSVHYESVGTSLRLEGRGPAPWLLADPVRALVDLRIHQSGIGPARVEEAAKLPDLPVFDQVSSEGALLLASGRPLLLVCAGGYAGEAGGSVLLTVVHLVASTSPAQGGGQPAVDGDPAETRLAVRDLDQGARVRLERFETTVNPGTAAGLGLGLPELGGAAVDLAARLSTLGTTRLADAAEWSLLLTADNSLAQGGRVPVVRYLATPSNARRIPSVSYEQMGSRLELTGRWRPDLPDSADVAWRMMHSSAVGTSAPSLFMTVIREGQGVIRSGEPLIATGMAVADDASGKPQARLVVYRLTLSRQQP
jgi:hypothetical protein